MPLNRVEVLIIQVRSSPKCFITVSHEEEGWYFIIPTTLN